jgi:hypothetical protein
VLLKVIDIEEVIKTCSSRISFPASAITGVATDGYKSYSKSDFRTD